MKGLEIARDYYFGWARPFLVKEFPDISERVAVGRFSGSDVLGADDEISRDHCWGPQFTLLLSSDDFGSWGDAVSESMNVAAPNPWKGFRLAGGGDKSVLVESIPQFFKRVLSLSAIPPTSGDWQLMDESALYFVRHGALWVDGTGEVGAWRDAVKQYPDHVRIRRIAEECFKIWHYGEYNFVQRMAKRHDPLAIAICLGEFTQAVMRIIFLIGGDFTPYWKWLPFEFRKLPDATQYVPQIEQLVQTDDIDEQVHLVKDICKQVHELLIASGTVSGRGGNRWLLPLLNDSNELTAKLKEGN